MEFHTVIKQLKEHPYYLRTEKQTTGIWAGLFEDEGNMFFVEIKVETTKHNPLRAELKIAQRLTHTPIACTIRYDFVWNRVWDESYSENFNSRDNHWVYDIFEQIKTFLLTKAEELEEEEEKRIEVLNQEKLEPLFILGKKVWVTKEEKEEKKLQKILRLLGGERELMVDKISFGYEPLSLYNFQYDYFAIDVKRIKEGEEDLFFRIYLHPRNRKFIKIEIS